MLDNRDYTLIVDKSGSMMTTDGSGNKTRWSSAEESTFALAAKCEQLDPDGITVYLFSGRFQRYDNVTSAKVAQVFQENEPSGRTDLASVLKDAVNHYFKNKASGEAKSGETILVITDGEPDDRKAVMKVIIEATRQMDRDEELAISMIQVGNDAQATRFLKALDDELEGVGAKFDIVDTITMDEMEDYTLSEVLLKAIGD
ncbi:VWA domain-containing protein [Phormidium pseudopriestleyi FRX01]|uniref:VWA domain-containing protein n=1 Tax=Phormidium pseudopriestleyi FRX01 TaxID=1759528 RepID=A0ABS3FWQ0_9CYAN|nr:VWA domain-containing protein [Phormidium pseudopriestleyi]MBO0351558.1 VWA domain-containing protein [Phormidium pseudopriestleyi FRX01]